MSGWQRKMVFHNEPEPEPRPDLLVTALWLVWIAIAMIGLAWWAGFIELVP